MNAADPSRRPYGAEPAFEGEIGRTYDDSTPWWPPLEEAPDGAPNVVVVLLDDVGYAQFGCYGSDIATPTFDALAAAGRRYANFHTTALCSPTRAALLTGRNHHSNGMARVVELAAGFPGYNATIPKENGFLSEILLREGYATFAVGKWHLAPTSEMSPGGRKDRWPLGRGFERFYGFLGGETDQYRPDLVHDNHPVEPPRSPEDGYHLTEDLAERAIGYLKDLRAASADRPFFLWFTPGAAHAPHQAPAAYVDAYRGCFDQGWDAWREEVFARQVESGLLPAGTELSDRPSWVPAWADLGAQERRLYARMMEVYAGFLTHTDAQVGRVLDFIAELGERDDTLVLLMSDNGASAEGGPNGSFNEQYFFNLVPESLEENLRRIDDLGTPRANNHYPWGWAWAGNTPFKRFKRDTHEGGVADPLIVSWPRRLGTEGGTRHQYVHAIDVAPTVCELLGITPPEQIDGVPQAPIEGASFAASLTDPDAPSPRSTQYYEMLGSRAIYHDGWKAVVFHPPAFLAYDGSDASGPFDDDVWELYDLRSDFAEVHDRASQEPDKLAEMQALWWAEAERFRVLPLNNQPRRFADRRFRSHRWTYRQGVGPIPESMAPALKNRSFALAAVLDLPDRMTDGVRCDGVIACHGSHAGGWVLAIADGRLRYTYNFMGSEITTVQATVALGSGRSVARVIATHRGEPGGPVDIALFYDGVPVGAATVPNTTLVTYGTPGFSVGRQPFGSIDPTIDGRSELPAGLLEVFVVEAATRDAPTPTAESVGVDRADHATQ